MSHQPHVVSPIEKMMFDYINTLNHAPKAPEIAEHVGLPLHATQLILAKLSQRHIITRSKKGLYRVWSLMHDLTHPTTVTIQEGLDA